MKRLFDVILSIVLIVIFAPVMLVAALIVRLTSAGPALYWSKRFGKNNNFFQMPKFRSMKQEAPQLPTHLIDNPQKYLTSVGGWLRRSSVDELPQLWSVLVGDMSLVGPRPALFNQSELIKLRTDYGVHQLRPGITGWAQVNGRDHLPDQLKLDFDIEYLKKQNFVFDLKVLLLTVVKVIKSSDVSH